MRVKNLNEATQKECNGAGLLAHWDRFSRQTAYRCFVNGCRNKCSVGGLVQKDSRSDKNWYVVPLCDECNKRKTQDLEIWDMGRLVPVNTVKAARVTPIIPSLQAPRTVRALS